MSGPSPTAEPGAAAPGPAAQPFQVDLHGVVDLLARHLYSGPRVYLRELLQNAIDAITARRQADPAAPARVRVRCLPDGVLEVRDTGVGLTYAQAEELLARIGASAKRDETLGLARREFLGQFGIGLLSAFMVADEVELVSLSALGGPAVRWRGFADGTYTLETVDDADPFAVEPGHEVPGAAVGPGSRVRLRARPDAEHWVTRETVLALAEDVAGLLPVDIAVEVPVGDDRAWRRVTAPDLPWRLPAGRAGGRSDGADGIDATDRDDTDDTDDTAPERERQQALARYCERTLGFTPLAAIDLDLPLAGLTGVAFVLPSAVSPTSRGAHRVYVKRMLVGPRIDGLLPDWAFFVRCVVNADGLRPTASREQLYEDEVLLGVRESLGRTVRDWLNRTLAEPSPMRAAFLEAHHLAVRALAVTDDTMLEAAAQVLPFETSDGISTIADVAADAPEVLWTAGVDEFRRVAPVARAQGLTVVNGGYVYDDDILARIAQRFPQWRVRRLTSDDVRQVLEPVDPAAELAWLDALTHFTSLLTDEATEVTVRRFEPNVLPAVLLHDRDSDHQRDLMRAAEVSDTWGAALTAFSRPSAARQLVLNAANPMVQRLLSADDGRVRDAGLRSLYLSARMVAGEPLRARDASRLTDALTDLLDAGLPPDTRPTPGAEDAADPTAGDHA